MSVIRLDTSGTFRRAKPVASHAGSQVTEIMDSGIRRFRRIVGLQQLGRAFRSLFSHAAVDLGTRRPGEVHDPLIPRIIAETRMRKRWGQNSIRVRGGPPRADSAPSSLSDSGFDVGWRGRFGEVKGLA